MMKPELFLTHSLRDSPHGAKVTRILSAALEAVDPRQAIKNHMVRQGELLIIDQFGYDLSQINKIHVVAFGKASIPMIVSVKEVLGSYFDSGIVITKSKPNITEDLDSSISIYQSSHPIPDQNSINCATEVVKQLSKTTTADLVIFLISGGGSALLTLPAGNITINDIQSITQSLLRVGATINEINCIRKHLSLVKGGGLVRFAAPSNIVSLILSDVIHDPLDVIASGPTIPDKTTFSEAREILSTYSLEKDTPKAILNRFDEGILGHIAETPKKDDPLFERVNNIIIGNNYQAAFAAKQQASQEGFNTLLLSTFLQGEAHSLGRFLASIAYQLSASEEPINRPACIIAGGETTVTISGDGLGGRNLEVALSAVEDLSELQNVMLVTLATDGEDGPTDAAGAVVTENTLKRAKTRGMDPKDILTRNDSYHFFNPLGDLLKPGVTETNVCDLNFIFAFS